MAERPKIEVNPWLLFWGVFVGVHIFVGVNLALGIDLTPDRESIRRSRYTFASAMDGVVRPERVVVEVATGPYQRVCSTCHQADGKGMKGAVPPLAGSDWVTQDPETPIRIALLGLKGPIEVNGEIINQNMPKPAGLTDQDIADALTFVRSNFGNDASEVTLDMVTAVKSSLAGRTDQWTAEELTALRAPAEPEPAAAVPDGGTPGEVVPEGEVQAEGDAPAPQAPEAAPAPQPEPTPAPEPPPPEGQAP